MLAAARGKQTRDRDAVGCRAWEWSATEVKWVEMGVFSAETQLSRQQTNAQE